MDWKLLTFVAGICCILAYWTGYHRGYHDGMSKLAQEELIGSEVQKRALKAFDLILDKIQNEDKED